MRTRGAITKGLATRRRARIAFPLLGAMPARSVAPTLLGIAMVVFLLLGIDIESGGIVCSFGGPEELEALLAP